MEPSSPPRVPRSYLPECTLLGALVAALGFFGFFQTEARRADALDRPLRQAWESFAATNQSSEATAGLSLEELPAALERLQQSAGELLELRQLVTERLQLPADTLERLGEPFLLIHFENERLRLAEELVALARSKKVGYEAAVTNGLPRYTADLVEPALLWARLEFARQVLLTALHAQVGAVRHLEQLPAVSHRSLITGRRYYEELPMRLEVVGTVDPVSRFLTNLPLRGAELEDTGLAGALTNKPVLFLSHLLLRKSAPDRPAEMRVELIVSGFVPQEALSHPGSGLRRESEIP